MLNRVSNIVRVAWVVIDKGGELQGGCGKWNTYCQHCILDTLTIDEAILRKIGDQGSIGTAAGEPCHV